MNRQNVNIYVVLPQDTYLYDARGHKLNLISKGDCRSAVAGGQTFVSSAPLSLVLVSDLSESGDVKNSRTQITGATNIGIVSQNVSLFYSTARLATVPRATTDTTRLRSALKLRDDQTPIVNRPIGYFK